MRLRVLKINIYISKRLFGSVVLKTWIIKKLNPNRIDKDDPLVFFIKESVKYKKFNFINKEIFWHKSFIQ